METNSQISPEEENKAEVEPTAEPAGTRKSWKDEIPSGAPSAPLEPPKPSRHIGRWALILLAVLIVGFGAAFIALALPAQQELRQAKADIADLQEKLSALETELDTTSLALAETTSELTSAEYDLALARVQANVAYARSSLVSRDLLTARQEVSAAVKNMEALLPLIEDKEIAAALSDRMEGIEKSIHTDSAKALEELRILSENLLRLQD